MTELLVPAQDAAQTPRSARGHWPAPVALLLILVIAAGLRLYKIDGQSLWQDEVYSVLSSNGWWAPSIAADQVLDPAPQRMSLAEARSLRDVCAALAEHDNHPPLYFLLLRMWRTVFGEGPAAARSLSLVASLIGLVLLTDVARMLFGWGPALWAAAIMAVAGPQIQFAQEIRGYMLLMAAGCGAMNALVRIKLNGPTVRRLAALVVCLVAMELTHFFAVGAAAGLAAYAMIALRGAARWRVLAAMVIAAGVFAAMWGTQTIRQFSNVNANNLYMLQGEQGTPAWVLMRLAKVPHRFFNEPMDSSAGLAMLSATAYVLPLLLVRRRPELLLGMLYVAGGVGIVAAFDLYRGSGNLDFIRYSLVAAPGAYLVTVGLLCDRRGWLKHVVPAVALLSCLVSLPRAYQYFIPIKPNWRALATAAATSMGPRDAIVLTGNPSDDWYYQLSSYHPAPPRRLLILTHPMTAEQAAALGSSERICVVGARENGDGISALVGDGPPLAEYHEAWLPPLAIYRSRVGASSGGPSTSPGYNAIAMKLPVLEKTTADNAWYADGLRFTCSQCGNCCTGGPGYVWIDRDEIVKLAAYLNLSPEDTIERYCRKVDGKFSLKERRSPAGLYDCIFLKETKVGGAARNGDDEKVVHTIRACTVYPVRPLQCRTWPFWPENLSSRQAWDHAAKKCHGMNAPGRTFSPAQIHAIRDAAEWPKNPPTSKLPTK